MNKTKNYFLGIDLGTTYLKTILLNSSGRVVAERRARHKTSHPQPGHYEQDPSIWWKNLKYLLQQTLQTDYVKNLKGISFSGQMHGLVLLDKNGEPLIPSITWEDNRAKDISLEIEKKLGWENIKSTLGNKPMPGFTLPKLLWVKRNLPEAYNKTFKVLLPKGFLRFKLTGNFSMEVSDASSGLLININNRDWANGILNELDIDRNKLPELYESTDISGRVSDSASEATGLISGIPVIAGAGDQQAGAIGGGINKEGKFSATIGTGGQVYTVSNNPSIQPEGRAHTFCHSLQDQWLIMGAMKTAGKALEWFKNKIMAYLKNEAEEINYEVLDGLAKKAKPGSGGVIFLPYLAGERTPHLDPRAKGLFFGLTLNSSLPQMVRSIMEGVSFNMRHSLELVLELGLPLNELRLEGGGVKSSIWPQIQADIFKEEITISEYKYDKSAYGAAVLAGLGTGDFTNIEEIGHRKNGSLEHQITPNESNYSKYLSNYELFKQLYLSVKKLF